MKIKYKFGIALFFLLLIAGEARSQDIAIYNMNGYGSSFGYRYDYPIRYYGGNVTYYIDPWYENWLYQRRMKELRYQNYVRVWTVRREEIADARYRNRMRKSGQGWLTMYSE